MEDDERSAADAPPVFATPFKGAPGSSRRLTGAGRNTDEAGGFKSPEELSALFARRASGLSMVRATPGKQPATPSVAMPDIMEVAMPDLDAAAPPPSPGKRARKEAFAGQE